MYWILSTILICNFIQIYLGIKPLVSSKKLEKKFQEWLNQNKDKK